MLRHLKHASWLLAVVLAVLPARGQQNPQRLVLKDGSYQSTTKYEIKGDRVRYYSADRFSWEEIPKELVDWPATEKYNQEHQKGRTVSADEIVKQDEADQKVEDAKTPQIMPGMRLPDGGGVFLFDVFLNQPQLIELVQNGGELNKHTGRNILRAALNPLTLSSKQTIELKGNHARIQSHERQPAIYVDIDTADETASSSDSAKEKDKDKDRDQQPDRYRIIRLENKKGGRVVGNLSIAVYGKVRQKEEWIKTISEPTGDWVKVSPAEPLPPGEYALVEMLDKKQMNLYVWDFGVNPNAPANATAWKPRQPAKSQTGTNESPVLGKRPPKN